MNPLLLLSGIGAGLMHSLYSAVSKTILNRRVSEPFLFLLYINAAHAVVSLPLWLIAPPVLPAAAGCYALLLAGSTSAIAFFFLYLSLSSGDVSSVMPVMGSKVIFSSVWAVLLLQEVHSAAIYGAIILVAAAVGMLGYSPGAPGRSRFPLKPVVCMLFSSLIFGLTDIYIKRSLDHMDSYNFLIYYNLLIVLFSLPLVPFIKRKRISLGLPVKVAGTIAVSAVFLLASTLLLVIAFRAAGGVVIPNILMSTRGIFIVLITAALTFRGSTMLDRQSKGVYLLRLLASSLIIISIWITLKS